MSSSSEGTADSANKTTMEIEKEERMSGADRATKCTINVNQLIIYWLFIRLSFDYFFVFIPDVVIPLHKVLPPPPR